MLTFNVHLESAVERESYSGIYNTRMVASLDLSVEEFCSEVFQLALSTFGCHLLEVRKTGDVPILTLILFFVQF